MGRTLIAMEQTYLLDARGVARIHELQKSFWGELERLVPGRVFPGDEMVIATAIGELVANVAVHAYADTPEAERLLTLRLEAAKGAINVEVRDRGIPFEGDVNAPLSEEPDDPLAMFESGRGLRMIRDIADTLTYRRTVEGENVWTLRKRLDT